MNNSQKKSTCDKGYKGDCCCICEHRIKVTKHPWNKDLFAKGNISETMGWGCIAQFQYAEIEGSEKEIMFSDRDHGCCELFDHK